MKKVKLVVLLVILAVIVLIGYQNMGFLLVKHHFGINLWFVNYQSPEIQNGVLVLGFFVAGLLLAFIATLRSRWHARRAIKGLAGEVTSSSEKITALERELAALKAVPQNTETVEESTAVSS